MNYLFYILALLFSVISGQAQKLPVTNVFCIYLNHPATTTNWQASKIELLNSYNYQAYNNQPYFINANEVLITSQGKGDDNTDIYSLDLQIHQLRRLVDNDGKDYSPRLSPDHSGDITCVHINKNDSVQNLCLFSGSDGSFKKYIFQGVGQIGYYRHFRKDLWVCFLVDQPSNLLSFINANTMEKKIFASSIGRTFEVLSQNEILFVHKILPDQWILKSYDYSSQKMTAWAVMPPASEDFALMQNGNVICASGSKLLLLDKDASMWKELMDLASLGIQHMQRIAIEGQKVLVVDEVK